MADALPIELIDAIIMTQRPRYKYLDELEGLIDAMNLTDCPFTDIKIIIDIANFLRANYTTLYDDLF